MNQPTSQQILTWLEENAAGLHTIDYLYREQDTVAHRDIINCIQESSGPSHACMAPLLLLTRPNIVSQQALIRVVLRLFAHEFDRIGEKNTMQWVCEILEEEAASSRLARRGKATD